QLDKELEKNKGKHKLAIALDLDETVLDNSPYQGYASIQLAYIDLNEYKDSLIKKLDSLQNQLIDVQEALIESPNSKKQKSKQTQLRQQITSTQRKIDDTEAII
ncbi:peptidoglycan bridge formation glycyltransferase FemA/FemB family protein, partial [Staphylococcus aureus]|nr:peptidoglycan bridge formation glycyltransferase FemA/FemB family protein [Staphylococcus aureus]